MSARKLWGEMEEEPVDEDLLENVNFNPIIELGLQNIPEISISAQSAPLAWPKPNLIMHTIHLHAYSRQLQAILAQAKKRRNFRLDPKNIPVEPEEPKITQHEVTSPIAFLERKFTNFTLGQGPVIVPFTAESHTRALRQCAAIALSHAGIEWSANSAVVATADALDTYLTNFCKTMRTIVDREATGLDTGFSDVMNKVLVENKVGNLKLFYENRVVKYHAELKMECQELRAKCEAIAAKHPARQVKKTETVTQAHFPANMDAAIPPSLGPGFQMLQTLEQEQDVDVDVDVVSTSGTIKVENVDFTKPGPAPKPSTSSAGGRRKKK